MEAAWSSKMLVYIPHTTWHIILEDHEFYLYAFCMCFSFKWKNVKYLQYKNMQLAYHIKFLNWAF